MKILFVSSQAIFKDTRFGGAKRLYYMARELEASVDLHIICLDGTAEILDSAAFPAEFANIYFIPVTPAVTFREKIPFLAESAKALKAHHAGLAAFLEGKNFDAVFIAYAGALRFLDTEHIVWPADVVYLEDDLLLEQMRLRVAAAVSFPVRIKIFFRHLQAKFFYKNAMRRISRFVCISRQEELIVRRRWPWLKTSLLGYGIPLKDFPMLPPSSRMHVMGFIGNYGHAPNADAAYWLVQTLFPAVLARVPDAQLVLCGGGFPDELRGICAGTDAIRIMANVADLSTFYSSISVFVNPIRTGRGVRTKAIEAAAYGRAILSTRLGAEGLEDFDTGLFETGDELAGLLLLETPEASARAVARNRTLVERQFSMTAVGGKLIGLLDSTAPQG